MVADVEAAAVPIFPRDESDDAARNVLLRLASKPACEALGASGVRSSMRVPFSADGVAGEFRCDGRTPRAPSFECHAAAELFAQMFAMRLELDRAMRG